MVRKLNISDFQNGFQRANLFSSALKNIKTLQCTSPHCWKKVDVPSSSHNEGSMSLILHVHLHHSAGHPLCRAEALKVISQGEEAAGGDGHGATRATKTTQDRIIQR